MKITKSTILDVDHARSGRWVGMAREDFDTEDPTIEWYPINLAQERAEGIITVWSEDAQMPCRKSLCTITIRNENQKGGLKK